MSRSTRIACWTLALLFLVACRSHAAVILSFGQTADTTVVNAVVNADRTTTITITDAVIGVTQYAGAVATPFSGFLNLDVTSTVDADPLTFDDAFDIGGNVFQSFAGTFSITSLAGGGGVNYLSGTFTDLFSGQGNTGTLQASDPPDSIVFTSDLLGGFSIEGISFSFASVTPAIGIDLGAAGTTDDTLAAFSASTSGTFSAEQFERIPPVPEPASLVIWSLGLGVLGFVGYKWRK